MPVTPQRDSQGNPIRNKWIIRIWVSGKEKNERFTGTKKQAEQREAEKRLELGAGESRGLKTAPLFSAYCTGKYAPWAEAGNLSKGTWRNRPYQIAVLVDYFEGKRLDEFTQADVSAFQAFRRGEGIGANKINDDVKVLVAILNHAKEHGYRVSPVKNKLLRVVRKKGKVRVWTDDEVQKLYAALEEHAPHLLPITVALVNTGMRAGEAMALQWRHIRSDRRLIIIEPSPAWQPKDNEPREVPLSDALLPYLRHAMGPRRPADPVFPSKAGRPYSRWPQRDWDNAREKSGVGGSPHVCRHTYASHFLAAIPDLYLLSQILGHSHEKVTQIYAHLLPDHLRRAVNAVNIGPKGSERVPATYPQPHGSETGESP